MRSSSTCFSAPGNHTCVTALYAVRQVDEATLSPRTWHIHSNLIALMHAGMHVVDHLPWG